MKFVSAADLLRPTRGIHQAAREISVQPRGNQYVVRYSDGSFSSPAGYHVATYWCRKARIHFALQVINSIFQLSAAELEAIADDYSCRPGRWQKLAREAINAARQQA